jgi:hypothetical protein
MTLRSCFRPDGRREHLSLSGNSPQVPNRRSILSAALAVPAVIGLGLAAVQLVHSWRGVRGVDVKDLETQSLVSLYSRGVICFDVEHDRRL